MYVRLNQKQTQLKRTIFVDIVEDVLYLVLAYRFFEQKVTKQEKYSSALLDRHPLQARGTM